MEGKKRYPFLNVDHDVIRENARVICDLCKSNGIDVAGVIKFSDGDPAMAEAYRDGGCAQIASSRTIHLQRIKKVMPDIKTMLIRIPMLSEIPDVIRGCDISLNSEVEVLRKLNEEAGRQGVTHSVILMHDVGDRREGIYEDERLVETALIVEKEMDHLHLLGVGASFACVSGVMPDRENLSHLCRSAEMIEEAIGRELEIVSGGSSVSLALLAAGKQMPSKVNHLRIGGAIANPMGIRLNRGVMIEGMSEDAFLLEAEIVEVGRKPSPQGGSGKNWSGQAVAFEDKGTRTRAIAALGSQDIGDARFLVPVDPGVEVIGGSSDHTVLDVTEADREWKAGDVVRFKLFYMPLLYCFATGHVNR